MRESDIKKDNTPFREELHDLKKPFKSHIKGLGMNSEKIVRKERVLHGTVEETIKWLKKTKEGFAVLRERYGVAIPKFDIVIGKTEESSHVFMVVDRVEGENVMKAVRLPDAAREKLDATYAAMTRYYFDAYTKESSYWADFYDFQFLYGHTFRDPEDKVYLVDIQPVFSNFLSESKDQDLYYLLDEVVVMMKNGERKFQTPVRFTRTRAELLRVLDSLASSGNLQDMAKLRQRLESA